MVTVKVYTDEFLSEKRYQADAVADDFVKNQLEAADKQSFYNWLGKLTNNASIKSASSKYYQESVVGNASRLPSWADAKLMFAGSVFFTKHAKQIMQLLGLLSLPYCYAAADGAMVLYVSQRLKMDSARRLSDTAEFIWDVMSPKAFAAEGRGFSACLKIRLTHAVARYYTLKNEQWSDRFGIPLNQEDMAGTNMAFSLIVIRGLRKLGRSISYAEQQSFLHLWNVVGCLLGIHEDLIPHDGKSANLLEQKIRQRQFKSSLQGKELASSLIDYFSNATKGQLSRSQTVSLMSYLLGDEVSNILELPKASSPFYMPVLLKTAGVIPISKNFVSIEQAFNSKYSDYKKLPGIN